MPDVMPYHEVSPSVVMRNNFEVIVYSDGTVLYLPSEIFKTACDVNYDNWPWGVQNCTFKVGSWVNSLEKMDVKPADTREEYFFPSHVSHVLGGGGGGGGLF
jgi:hypothetical protein